MKTIRLSGSHVPTITKDGKVIDSVESWFRLAPPKDGEKQWIDVRSAKELAKAWFPAAGHAKVPVELERLLSSHPDTKGSVVSTGTPEVRIPLDDFPGETRNADMVLLAERAGETLLLTIEAKADERFDMTIGEKIASAPHRSNIPSRVDHLCSALFGVTPTDNPDLKSLRYQLLHGMCATLIAASERSAAKAVFVVHEFATDKTDEEKRRGNHADMAAFIRTLSRGTIVSLKEGSLVGPLTVPGGKHVPASNALYVGKITAGQN